MAASFCRASSSRTKRSAAELMRSTRSPACEAILPARLNRAKRSFLGRAQDKWEGSASDCTALGLLGARARGPTWTAATYACFASSASLRPLRFMALSTL